MRILSIILLTILLNACQFNQSTKKDLITGAYSRGDGLGADDVKIEINGKTENRNTYIHGEKVNFLFNDIKGLKKMEGKSFPGLSINIINKNNDTLLSESDLFKDLSNGTDISPLLLNAHFVAALPVDDGYKVYINIWDKKGDGTFSYEMPFTVEENKLLEITANNIKYNSIYLWNESKKQPVFDKNIDINDEYILLSEGLEGLKSVDGNVYPLFSIELVDGKGNKIISNANVLSQHEESGVNAEKFTKGQVPITITFKKGIIHNPATFRATLTDKNSTNRLDIKTELVIE